MKLWKLWLHWNECFYKKELSFGGWMETGTVGTNTNFNENKMMQPLL